MEHQQQFEFQQDPANPISDDQIKQRMLQAYLCLYPIYEDQKKYQNNVFVIKNMGKITGTVTTKKTSNG